MVQDLVSDSIHYWSFACPFKTAHFQHTYEYDSPEFALVKCPSAHKQHVTVRSKVKIRGLGFTIHENGKSFLHIILRGNCMYGPGLKVQKCPSLTSALAPLVVQYEYSSWSVGGSLSKLCQAFHESLPDYPM